MPNLRQIVRPPHHRHLWFGNNQTIERRIAALLHVNVRLLRAVVVVAGFIAVHNSGEKGKAGREVLRRGDGNGRKEGVGRGQGRLARDQLDLWHIYREEKKGKREKERKLETKDQVSSSRQ